MRARPFAALLLASCFLLACGGAAPEPAPVAPPEPPPCCSIDDVIEMSKAGVDEELIIASVHKSEVDVEIGARELIRLNDAGVSKPVQQALMGDDPQVVEEAAQAEVQKAQAEQKAAEQAARPQGPPPLQLSVEYSPGSKSFKLTNTGTVSYTGVVITANGQYVYALPVQLPPRDPDGIKLSSLNSSRTGQRLHPNEGLHKLHVKADHGSWSKRF